jgi:ubiquinone/menaquinone biosynthesis C-methylase UbiE
LRPAARVTELGAARLCVVDQVPYDDIAPVFDRRYARNQYEGTLAALLDFVEHAAEVAEIGCGTGHWLAELSDRARTTLGVDPSQGMLDVARATAPNALLVRARAEALPLRSATVDRVFAINAFHHFVDKSAFVAEAKRVLRPGGRLLTIGLDPHTGLDQWWVYDYFPAALVADRERYPPAERIRELLTSAGFVHATTEVAQHMPAERPFAVALEQGVLDRRSTSQLMVISGADYDAGFRRLEAERPVLRADLRLYMTVAHVPAE